MRFNTGNPVEPDGSIDPRDLLDNAAIADLLINGPLSEYLSRLGVPLKSWQGIMQQVTDHLIAQGYESVYLVYGAGVIVQRQTQLVQRDGELYRVMNASDVPLTLTGTWATDSPKLQAVGDAALRQEVQNNTDPTKGSAIVGRSTVVVSSVKDLLSQSPLTKNIFLVTGYYSGAKVGGGRFLWAPTTQRSLHNGGDIISPTVPFSGLQSDIASFLAGVGETAPGGTGCFVRLVEKLDPWMYGAVGDDVANDLASIAKAVSRLGVISKTIDFRNQSFYCGPITVNEAALFTITEKDNIRVEGMPKIRVDNQLGTSPALQYTSIFEVIDSNDPYIECHAISDSHDKSAPRGPVAVNFKNVSKTVRGGRVVALCEKGLGAFQTRRIKDAAIKRDPLDPTWHGVTYEVEVVDCEYGVRLVASGDGYQGRIKSLRAGRSFFPVGVNNHICHIDSEAPELISDVLIKAYADNVENIVVFLNQRNADGAAWPVTIEHQNNTGDTSITNIQLYLNITGRVNSRVFVTGETTKEYVRVGSVFNSSGTLQTSTTCITDNIFIRGAPKSLGVVTGIRDPILNLPTATTNPGRIFVDFIDTQRTTNGFTIINGGIFKAKAAGSLATNPARVDLRDCYPSGGTFFVETHLNANFADNTMANSLSRGDLILLAMDSAGAGSIIGTTSIYSHARGTAPTVTFSVVSGTLVATGAGSTASSAETNLCVQPLGGRFI
ncbi:hypothetical protein [Pseudomonas kilonensis]